MVILAPFINLTPPHTVALAPEYTILLEHQIALRPHSLFFGFLPPAWSTLQQRYLTARNLPRDKQQADRWMKAIIRHCHDFYHTLWLLHNSHLHSKAAGASTSYKHLNLLAQLEALYACAPHMLAQDQEMFSLPFEDRQLQSTRTLYAFYTFVKPPEETSIKKAQDFGTTF
jgi:hypothetical protein